MNDTTTHRPKVSLCVPSVCCVPIYAEATARASERTIEKEEERNTHDNLLKLHQKNTKQSTSIWGVLCAVRFFCLLKFLHLGFVHRIHK